MWLEYERDLNAAINILRQGMQSVRKNDRSPVLQDGERSRVLDFSLFRPSFLSEKAINHE